MIVTSFGHIQTISGHDHGKGPAGVSDSEMRAPTGERVWLNEAMTSGRIIGWRVGT